MRERGCGDACFVDGGIMAAFTVSSNTRINGPRIQNAQSLRRERLRHAAYPGTIHPYSDFRWYWDILLTLVIFGDLVCKPLQIAFYSPADKQDLENIFWLIWTYLGVSVLYFADIAVNFRSGVQDKHSEIVILDLKQIAWKYGSSWFLIDLISSIPYDFICYSISEEFITTQAYYAIYRIVRILMLLKILRLFRVIQTLQRIERAYQVPEIQLRLINLLIFLFIMIHWIACWHWIMAEMFNPPGNDVRLKKKGSWITQAGLWDKPHWLQYMSALFIAVSLMCSVGYGRITPTEPEDIVAYLVTITVGFTCFAMFVVTLAEILESLNASQQRFEEAMMMVREYMKFRNIPGPLQSRVRTYFEQRYRGHYFKEARILQNVSNVLRSELQMLSCRHLVEKVPLFKETFSRELLLRIMEKLQLEVYLPGDRIIEEGTEGSGMYFIQEGEVDILNKDGVIINTLRSGEYFGEVSVVLPGDHKTTATVVAKDFSNVYILEREDALSLFQRYSDVHEKIKEVAQVRNRKR